MVGERLSRDLTNQGKREHTKTNDLFCHSEYKLYNAWGDVDPADNFTLIILTPPLLRLPQRSSLQNSARLVLVPCPCSFLPLQRLSLQCNQSDLLAAAATMPGIQHDTPKKARFRGATSTSNIECNVRGPMIRKGRFVLDKNSNSGHGPTCPRTAYFL
jgi:hypothetical protein